MVWITKLFLIGLMVIGATGCTTNYLADRGRDGLDVFTATAGVVSGASVRVGPVGLGSQKSEDAFGLRGGEFGSFWGDHEATWLVLLVEERFASAKVRERGKEYGALSWLTRPSKSGSKPKPKPKPKGKQKGVSWGGCGDLHISGEAFLCVVAAVAVTVAVIGSVTVPVETGRKPVRRSPFIWHWPYLTQIEAAAGFGAGIRLGVNPGEFLDFLLGWFGLDPYCDDLGVECS
ncbi:hypothetical protein BVY04_03710 [bacterium M21]|nr:hypothetical protein BVY04_03710 [bacterium M21]